MQRGIVGFWTRSYLVAKAKLDEKCSTRILSGLKETKAKAKASLSY
jgi:hypothetical protein